MENVKLKVENEGAAMPDSLVKGLLNHTEETFKAFSHAKKARYLCEVMQNTFFTKPISEEMREGALYGIAGLFDIIFDYVVKAECQAECVKEEAEELHELASILKREGARV